MPIYGRSKKSLGILCITIFLAKNALSSTDFSNNDKSSGKTYDSIMCCEIKIISTMIMILLIKTKIIIIITISI